jgi:hypothetical protein
MRYFVSGMFGVQDPRSKLAFHFGVSTRTWICVLLDETANSEAEVRLLQRLGVCDYTSSSSFLLVLDDYMTTHGEDRQISHLTVRLRIPAS